MSNESIPRHVAIIVDGNRRWARQRMMPASLGHKAGFERLKEITRYALSECGVKVLSLYVFSTENFARDPKEVGYLMDLFANNFRTIADEMNERNCQVLFSGRRDGLQPRVCDAMDYMMDLTKNNTSGIVNFCLNYGGHAELTDAVRAIAGEVQARVPCPCRHQRIHRGIPPVPPAAPGGFPDPHQRRAAHLQLPAVAGRLRRVLLHAGALPRFRQGSV